MALHAGIKKEEHRGSSDIPLDEEGLEQARSLAERIESGEWDVLYSSDLMRAKQTAEILNVKLETEMYLDSRLRERSGGLIEGTTEEERVQKWGADWRELDVGFETHESIISRGLSFIEDISAQHQSQKILIVSHGAFIKRLLNELLSDSPIEESLKNNSLTCLIRRENGWHCDLFNCTAHLLKADTLEM